MCQPGTPCETTEANRSIWLVEFWEKHSFSDGLKESGNWDPMASFVISATLKEIEDWCLSKYPSIRPLKRNRKINSKDEIVYLSLSIGPKTDYPKKIEFSFAGPRPRTINDIPEVFP